MMLYGLAMQKKALDSHGGLYNSDPATSVSDGPFVLKEWRKSDRLIFDANPKYRGTNKPLIQRVINIGMPPPSVTYQVNSPTNVQTIPHCWRR
jgi:peptide/nickel transport system substrate-binding protein/oligopeptide transport system substrate-binding protein